jgi:hypothetical protein
MLAYSSYRARVLVPLADNEPPSNSLTDDNLTRLSSRSRRRTRAGLSRRILPRVTLSDYDRERKTENKRASRRRRERQAEYTCSLSRGSATRVRPVSPDRNKRGNYEMGCGNKVKFQDIGIHGKIANAGRAAKFMTRPEYLSARECGRQ